MTAQEKIVHAIQLVLAIPALTFIAACASIALGY